MGGGAGGHPHLAQPLWGAIAEADELWVAWKKHGNGEAW